MRIEFKLTSFALLSIGFVVALYATAGLHDLLVDESLAVLLLMGFSGGILAIVTFVLVGRPMRRLNEMARRYGAGDLSGRMELRQRDEIGELAHVMSQMGEEL